MVLPTSTHNRKNAYIVLAFSLLGMGFSGIFVSLAGAPGAVSAFYRMAIAVVVLTIPYLHGRRRTGPPGRHETIIALLAGLFFAGDLFFWNSGILISGATNPTLMGNTAPIWVGFGAMIFFGERPGRLFWIGLLVAIAGAAVILGVDALNEVGLGTFFGVLSGMFYAGYFLVVQRSRQKLNTLTSFWLAAIGSSVGLVVIARLLGQPLTGYSNLTYLYMIALSLVVQVGGQMGVSYALGYLPASIVSPTLLMQPVLTGLLAVPILGERLTLIQITGGITVLIGIYIVHRSRRQPVVVEA
ncbi:MAG: DMT family transporter [Anaerolineales bacterium]|uniref:DMT family transporter n=1 Tax=Promineifilum sp. TaxID=2664178 RepID=UPI001D5BD5F3|nr:DMT family transporter [Anaerolineales bacterium]MCB8934627.1 DMT family transporter [Promineifilum sp.]MCO5180857.1 DMT family transporter [Promineifilum sp.]